ncbi:hypothetical protein Vqi01_31060 [Micromonospora qiuiae]|uniref:N,N-dimethylformamidase beta subunit-like C-terminal domain-containing protein n=1 Tax=Micromonospora qiuiae TaxID=502268 RepID=A0ABQ4JCP4_9ACTN|nr:N,N-dimethylformamidase beta subunit family domain-containing protein [Micromonospora qiuiae]GIJ27944.1 hypothetical protein Vqi01_31060 [Micromonospora qiuiae]
MPRLSRRGVLGLLVGSASVSSLGAAEPVLQDRRTGTLIEVENQASGERWWPTRSQHRAADDRQRQIQGYASATSVAPGESIDFHVTVNPAGRYRISIHRLGWYRETANSVYWHIRSRPAAGGQPDRVVACYRTTPDPGQDSAGPTVRWRDIKAAEQKLIGVQFNGIVDSPQPLVVQAADHWFWKGTGVADGDRIPGVVDGEADGVDPHRPHPVAVSSTVLSASPYQTRDGRQKVQNTHLYETPQGGLVFGAGTLGWTMALNRSGHRDQRIERATTNMLDRIIARSEGA